MQFLSTGNTSCAPSGAVRVCMELLLRIALVVALLTIARQTSPR
jgi:hypothetical protein